MRSRLRWLIQRAGRRGAFLGFLATLDCAYGYSLYVTAGPARVYDLFLPWEAWGVIWMTVGVICAASVLALRDRFAFAAAAMLKGAWALLFTDVWLFQRYPRGWVAVIVWAAFAGAVLIVSGWPEPIRTDAELIP
jgi:hypothetical protein